MNKLEALDNYLALNFDFLDPEVVAKIKEIASKSENIVVLTKKAFVLFFWQQYQKELINLKTFMYVGDFSVDSSNIWSIGWKLEGMYFLWGLFLQGQIKPQTVYVVDKLVLNLFKSKHPNEYERLMSRLGAKESNIVPL